MHTSPPMVTTETAHIYTISSEQQLQLRHYP